jgi:hypothetical protein
MKESPVEEHTRLGNDYEEWKITAGELFANAAVLNRERERGRNTVQTRSIANGEARFGSS